MVSLLDFQPLITGTLLFFLLADKKCEFLTTIFPKQNVFFLRFLNDAP